MQTDQKMVAYYLRKWGFDFKNPKGSLKWIFKGNEILILRTLNEFLKWFVFKEMRFWEYCYVLKIKEVNLKTIQCMN